MNPPLQPVLVTDEQGLVQVEAYLRRVDSFVIDVETNFVKEFYERKIRTIQLGDRNEQFIIDLLPFAQRAGVTLEEAMGSYKYHPCLEPVVQTLRLALTEPRHLKIGVNIQFDYETIKWNLGIRMFNLYCCFLAEKVIHAGAVHFMTSGFWALENLVARYCGLHMDDTETGKGFDLITPLTDKQVLYTALDVRMPLAVRIGQLRTLEKDQLMLTAQIEFDALPAFGDIHLNGLLLDSEKWMALVRKLEDQQRQIVAAMDNFFVPVVGTKVVTAKDEEDLSRIEEMWRAHPSKTPEEKEGRKKWRLKFFEKRREINDRRKDAEKCEGEAFINYGASGQMKDALLALGYKKKDLPDTSDRTLESLAEYRQPDFDVNKAFELDPTLKQYKVIDLIRLHRSTSKMLTTYGVAWVNTYDKEGHVSPFTGRIHSNLNQMGAATGRTSSSAPNVQNIPRGSDYRSCFIARPGYKIVTIDFSGCELRILAELSGEPVWIQAFRNDWDVHSVCAEILFEEEWKQAAEPGCAFAEKKQKCKCKLHKKLRDIAKTLNFGLAYGMGPQKLADGVGITYEHAVEVFEKFKHTFPIVFRYLENSGKQAALSMQARTMANRRRLWIRPTWEDAIKRATKDNKGKPPTQEQIRKKYKGMFAAIEREGKNASIQGTNADMAKLAMAYVAAALEAKYGAFLINMVHDELVVEAPEHLAEEVKEFVSREMSRAGEFFVKSIPMTTEGAIADMWSK